MKRWGYLLTFVSGAFLTVVLGLTISATFKASSVTAQQASSQKWEYCAVRNEAVFQDGTGRWRGGALIQYFQAEGTREETIRARSELGLKSFASTPVTEDSRAKALTKLGNEGWEMVGVEVTGEKSNSITYILKRPKL
ncbi:MAG TPA: hypothetical protein VEF04_01520 [Blastocatellia bacterium]|nr:hypothetical protein [Blastocatellia bacterium]